MPAARPSVIVLVGSATLALAAGQPGGHGRARASASPSTAIPADREAVVHALNRLAWGPRPGEVDAVHRAGLARWIARQLRPEDLADTETRERLAELRTLRLSSADLLRRYDLAREAKREAQQRLAEMESASEQELRRARRELARKYAPDLEGSPRQVLDELQAGKIVRAVHGERQLEELLVDFWTNHFNVYARKGPVRFLAGEYERDVIRPRVLGRFEDLLRATAESPAMLFYLDNWLSTAPDGGRGGTRRPRAGRDRRPGRSPTGKAPPSQGRRRGINENYARELLELHTLGVDGGYTQQDVDQIARAFTGWTIRGLREDRPAFAFDARRHDGGDKRVLGHTIPGGGRDEGDRILHILATHPSTARFVAGKLARRFVADEPPAALVERLAATFARTGGDLRAVTTALVTSPEFFAPQARGAKVKTPFDYVVSAVRAAGGQVEDGRDLARRVADMGMPLYLQQPPTGYEDTADAWVSTSGLLARLNFALDLTAGRVRGVSRGSGAWPAATGGQPAREELARRLVPQGLSDGTRAALEAEARQGLEPVRLAGLLLGSPEFQRR